MGRVTSKAGSWGVIGISLLVALLAVATVFVFDLLQESPVMADVIERENNAGQLTVPWQEEVTVSWIDEAGSTITEKVRVPPDYVGEDRLPIIDSNVDDGRLSRSLYVFAALSGLITGGSIAGALRKQPYSEAPIREVVTGAGA